MRRANRFACSHAQAQSDAGSGFSNTSPGVGWRTDVIVTARAFALFPLLNDRARPDGRCVRSTHPSAADGGAKLQRCAPLPAGKTWPSSVVTVGAMAPSPIRLTPVTSVRVKQPLRTSGTETSAGRPAMSCTGARAVSVFRPISDLENGAGVHSGRRQPVDRRRYWIRRTTSVPRICCRPPGKRTRSFPASRSCRCEPS